jgi:hypothetical protein
MKSSFCVKVLVLTFILITSCSKKEIIEKNKKSDRLEIINLDITSHKVYPEKGKFEDYFESYDIIPLETTPKSTIAKIERIFFFKDKFFLLDLELDELFIFDKKGKFLNKINNKGKGPNEYIGLSDFTINEDEEKIVLYSNFPKKILVYDIEGKFIKQYKQDKQEEQYRNIAYNNKSFLFLKDEVKHSKPFLIEQTLSLENKTSHLYGKIKDVIFDKMRYDSPNIISSGGSLYTSFIYSDTIYRYNSKLGFEARYFIDFDTQRTPLDIYKSKKQDLFSADFLFNNEYGFGITDFRETENYLVFKYHCNKLIIHSKKNKKTSKNLTFYKDFISFSNYKAHSGNDNTIISIVDSELFPSKMKFFKKNRDKWNQIPDKVKEIFKSTSVKDNPLLLVYKFK